MVLLYHMNHEVLGLEDRLHLIEELEHERRHALRAARIAHTKDDKENELFWLVTAGRCTEVRRKVQNKLGEIETPEWCPLKSAQAIRQLNYETMTGDIELFNELEELVDSINSHVLKQDLTDCAACKSDREMVE